MRGQLGDLYFQGFSNDGKVYATEVIQGGIASGPYAFSHLLVRGY